MPANHSNTNRVIAILIHSHKTHFQIVFVTLLCRVAKDVTSSLLSWHKHYDFNAANFRHHSQWNYALQSLWIRIQPYLRVRSLTITPYVTIALPACPKSPSSRKGSSMGSRRKCRIHSSWVRLPTCSLTLFQSSLNISSPSNSRRVSWSVHSRDLVAAPLS